MKSDTLDAFDLKILNALQDKADRSMSDLAGLVGLSPSACHRRIGILRDAGIIEASVARINPEALGYSVHVFVEITLTEQSEEALAAFEMAATKLPVVLECHLISGRADYLVRIAARSITEFEEIHRTGLARLPGVSNMATIFSLKTVQPYRGISLGAHLTPPT